ncbi:MAG: hypothetical protein ACI89U_000995, partial [Gammaproteobacteria bacterium]
MKKLVNNDAVMFFADGDVVKEMLYPEFEAILDHVVAIEDFKGTEVPAVFLRINNKLDVIAAVFFHIDFDERGFTDNSWNIPLQHLVDNSGAGPDMGSGAIKLSCRSQCSVAWHQKSLWDPDFDSDINTFSILDSKAKRNRLGLIVPNIPEEFHSEFAAGTGGKFQEAGEFSREEFRRQMELKVQEEIASRLLSINIENQLGVAAAKQQSQDHIGKLHEQYRVQILSKNELIESTKQLFSEEKHKTIRLKEKIEKQAKDFQEIRESFQLDIMQDQEFEKEKIIFLEEKFELELQAKLASLTIDLKEMLDMREVELFYRDEQIGRLNSEVSQLRKEKKILLDSGGDRVLHRLVEKGITFVAYRPGFEHITVPVSDISSFLEEPLNYMSAKCSVDPEKYRQWLTHFELPVCSYTAPDGTICGEPLVKVDNPADFVCGESDLCQMHSDKLSTAIDAKSGTV